MASAMPMENQAPAPMGTVKPGQFCPRCGARIYPGDIACQLCGYVVGGHDDDG
ncbi:MAG: hypothetical protein RBS34_14790 [Desulfofustis sp.]|nr:hypothetical protein [Desulfofustis sp.]